MSSEQTSSQADFRSTAQDYKRDAARKHKWALGPTPGVGRAEGKPRPLRSAATAYNARRREEKGAAVHSLAQAKNFNRKHDVLEGTYDSSANESSSDRDTPSPPPADAEVTYSFDAARGPTKGSQILNAALAKAVESFQEKETVKLVKSEYELLDSDGETVRTPAKKGKGKNKSLSNEVAIVPDADEDYEFV